jgi:solute carrier family 25 (mitochondrial iron transporter), member 28/37
MQIINPSPGGLYTGLTNAVSTIYRIEGIRTLWRGVSSVIVGAGGIFFQCVDGENG